MTRKVEGAKLSLDRDERPARKKARRSTFEKVSVRMGVYGGSLMMGGGQRGGR